VDREDRLAQVLAEFAHTLAADFSIEETLDHLVARIVTAVPVTGAGIMLRGHDHESYIVAASDERVQEIEQLQNDLQEGPCLTAYFTGEPVLLPDLSANDRFPRYTPLVVEMGVAAVFTFPLRLDGRRLGALDLYRDTVGELDPGAMSAAEVLADVAAAYLFNARIRGQARESERELRHRSLHDPLTGLPNRTLLEERLDHAAQRAIGSERILAVLFVDLDGFKAVNDRFGHQLGDQLLNAVGSRLSESLRPGDTLARLAGDEFVIVCEDLTDSGQAEVVADRVARLLSTPIIVGGQELSVTASVGVAFSGGGRDLPKDLLRDADVAMYEAKRAGGAQYRVLHPTNSDGPRNIDDLLADTPAAGEFGRSLQEALERDELRLAYQPIVDTRDGSLSGVEALLRWKHPRRGWVEPDVVVAVAERTGAIFEVGRWALTQACRDLETWRHRYGAAAIPHVAVNVSARQLMARGFVDTVKTVLSATGTDSASLHLEVTESVFLEDAPTARTVLNELRRLGVKLSLDDFGTGYSSLAYLEEFRFDIIKIDQTFTAGMVDKRSTRAIVAAVIELAHALDLAVVAEGVETEAQLAELNRLGSDRAQGHLFSPALLPEDFDRQILEATDFPIRLPLQRT
jgi:diguanylate cyclase (GGDEF)-like protein